MTLGYLSLDEPSISLPPREEVGESSAAGAARQDRPTIDDLVGAIDEITPTTVEGVNQRVTDLATIVEEETTSMYGIMEDAQDGRSQLRGRVNLCLRNPVQIRNQDQALYMFIGAMETDIQEKDEKQSQKRQNQARDGKDKVKSKPKSVKVRKSTQTKSKVNQVKKIQLEGLKLPNLKLYYKNNKTRTKIGNWGKYNLRGQSCQLIQSHFFPAQLNPRTTHGFPSPSFTLQTIQHMDKTFPLPPLSPPAL
ncbi:hypothetical protein Tco_0273055 [Tanacetum coccineum]